MELNEQCEYYRRTVERWQGRRDVLAEQLQRARLDHQRASQEVEVAEQARLLIQEAGRRTQEQLHYHLAEICQLALKAVFGDSAYRFEVAVESRRNRSEVSFWFCKGKADRLDPRSSCGMGTVDVVGMSLRISLWSLRRPRTRPSIWVDEPFKHLKGAEANRRVLDVFRHLTQPSRQHRWPGIQLVMIADERTSREELTQVADRMWEFQRTKNGTTKVLAIDA